jgi:DNA polymerase-3 subunit alpha
VDYQPTSLVELAHIGALVRPGPQRSGITEEYLNRRRSGCVESQPDSRLEDILAPTQSLMIFQDQILQICFRLADYTDVEADHVRKILGKKKPEEAKIEGDKFVSQCCANDVEEQVARNLWNTMERFALYGFNFGHSMGYGLLSYWCAWFATHYPLYFITALLSTVKDESIPSCVTEAQRLGYRVLPPDINASGRGFTVDPDNLAIRYGLESVKGLGPAAVEAIFENRPFVDWEDFRARKGAKVNVGYVKVLNAVGALESIAGHRRWIEQYLELEALPSGQRCIHYDEHADNHGLPCSFDWESLPPAVGRTGKPLKKQPGPPKKCSRACKQFVPLQSPSASEVEPYTAQQQGRIEADVLGLSLSYSPFDDIPADIRAEVSTAHDVAYGTDGRYLCLGVLSDVCTFADRRDRPMAFVTLSTERGSMRVTVFARQYTTFRTELVEGALVVCSVTHNDRGQVLDSLDRIDAEETAHV